MSPMALPLMSSLVRLLLLPRALSTMVRSVFSLESARDREVRGWREVEDGGVKRVQGNCLLHHICGKYAAVETTKLSFFLTTLQ